MSFNYKETFEMREWFTYHPKGSRHARHAVMDTIKARFVTGVEGQGLTLVSGVNMTVRQGVYEVWATVAKVREK